MQGLAFCFLSSGSLLELDPWSDDPGTALHRQGHVSQVRPKVLLARPRKCSSMARQGPKAGAPLSLFVLVLVLAPVDDFSDFRGAAEDVLDGGAADDDDADDDAPPGVEDVVDDDGTYNNDGSYNFLVACGEGKPPPVRAAAEAAMGEVLQRGGSGQGRAARTACGCFLICFDNECRVQSQIRTLL